MQIRYIGPGDQLTEHNIQRLNVMQEIVFGEIYVSPDASNDFWWIAFDREGIAGFCCVTVYDHDDGSKTAFLSLAGVLHQSRGQGLQRKMVKKREALAKEHGCYRIISYCSRDNIISANNLIKAGYLLYTPEYDWGIENAFYFQKMLEHDKDTKASIAGPIREGTQVNIRS